MSSLSITKKRLHLATGSKQRLTLQNKQKIHHDIHEEIINKHTEMNQESATTKSNYFCRHDSELPALFRVQNGDRKWRLKGGDVNNIATL